MGKYYLKLPKMGESIAEATTRYKFNDKTPGLYKSTNYGKTWREISGDIPYGAYTRVVREDNIRKDLLFAGTELGVYISFNGGKEWEKFNLNMPSLAVTDLMIKHDDLIIASQGRSFWILDDMGLIRQYDGSNNTTLFKPENLTKGNWYSPLNSNNKGFDGTSSHSGVNPANGIVIYYNINKDDIDNGIRIQIKDEKDGLIREVSNNIDKDFISYNGGPSREPVLSNNIGLNRFVWDTRHTSLPGLPYAYIEGRFGGHKAIPGKYKINLMVGDKNFSSDFKIKSNPNYKITKEEYSEFDKHASHMENQFSEMAGYVNKNKKLLDRLSNVIKRIDNSKSNLINQGLDLNKKMQEWDEKMMQRKSLAYDDVENFPNKFIADYLFILDEMKGDIPIVTNGVLNAMKELDKKWMSLKDEIVQILNQDLKGYNKELWANGIGAVN